MMNKDNISILMSVLTVIGGYFLYEYIVNTNPSYAIIAIILTMLTSLAFFSYSKKGRKFWLFFKDVKIEFHKIYFPKLNEISSGLLTVFIFCAFFLTVISAMDYVFLNLYNSLI